MKQTKEVWKPAFFKSGFFTESFFYEVSNLGRVRRIKTGRVLRQYSGGSRCKKYLRVQLSVRGKRKTWRVHVLVMRTFKGMPPQLSDGTYMELNHKDLNCKNPRLNNLEYTSHTSNVRHWREIYRKKGISGREIKSNEQIGY